MRVLIDSSIQQQHSLSHRGAWQSDGSAKWGGIVTVLLGRIVSERTATLLKESRGGDQAPALGAVARAFMDGTLKAFTTDALMFEQINLPRSGSGFGDVNLLSRVKKNQLTTLPDFTFSLPGEDPVKKLREHLETQRCEPFVSIYSALNAVAASGKHSQDAWHLHCCIVNSIDAFLTADVRLIGQVKSIPNKATRKLVEHLPIMPKELCAMKGIDPLSTDELDALARELGATLS